MNPINGLNERQKQAAAHTEGPLLIIAGAGAGKTKTITHRIANLVSQGVPAHSVLAVTFTNKAAGEMRERVARLLGDAGAKPFIATFHALSVRLLREFAKEAGVPRTFVIWDRDDSLRALKRVVKEKDLGDNPRGFLGAISREKGQGKTQGEYAVQTKSWHEREVATAWHAYEQVRVQEGALDFDDLLLYTRKLLIENNTILERLRRRWTHLHVDEYQDTSAVQYDIVRLLAGERKNICVVGDLDQCLAADTLITLGNGTRKKISKLRVGERILSNYGSGVFREARITRVRKRVARGELIRITTTEGRTLVSTPEHIHFAAYRLGISSQHYFTYLMWKKNVGWRLGVSQVYTKGQRLPMVGFVQRCNHEHADAVWILATHSSMNEARVLEYTLSLKHGIPTLPFVARKSSHTGGYVHDQTIIDRIFTSFDTERTACDLLTRYGLSRDYPHHRPRSRNSNRRNVVVTLCAGKRAHTPMHHISMVGNDEAGRRLLAEASFSVRRAKENSLSWRFETAYKTYADALHRVAQLKKLFPDLIVIEMARLGGKKKNPEDGNSLPFLPAGSVMSGMALFDETGGYDVVERVERIPAHNTPVYDLDIEATHNFIANGLITHNCIYTWRQATPENLLLFEKSFPGTTVVMLEQNYRSTQTILTAANAVIAKNKNRYDKRLFTENGTGEAIELIPAPDERAEARAIVLRIRELLAQGVAPSEIALLYRENFQSRVLEEACIESGIPYRVLGVQFFDRAEVKTVLSYLRASLNPKSSADLTRIIGVPARGIGATTLAKILNGREVDLSGTARAKVETFRALLSRIRDTINERVASEAVRFAFAESGHERALKEGSEEERARRENVYELISLATGYDTLPPPEGIERLLEDAALMSEQDALAEKREAVSLMTVHASKGLEFDAVFVTGLEQGLFPSQRESGDRDPEEERRLFYVALTRARTYLFLSYAMSRARYGKRDYGLPSEFLDDIDPRLIQSATPLEPATRGRGILDSYENDIT